MFQAIINVPGYLPQDDQQHLFDTAAEAWQYLADERIRDLDDPMNDEDDGHDAALEEMESFQGNGETGTVYGFTPGDHGDHDLGLAYAVVKVPDPTIRIVINVRTVDPYDEDGEWMDGDTREISSEPEQEIAPDAYDLESVGGDQTVWAAAYLRPLEAFEPSMYPVGNSTPEHGWLGACYRSPVDTTHRETTVRIYGVTDEERAFIFREVTR